MNTSSTSRPSNQERMRKHNAITTQLRLALLKKRKINQITRHLFLFEDTISQVTPTSKNTLRPLILIMDFLNCKVELLPQRATKTQFPLRKSPKILKSNPHQYRPLKNPLSLSLIKNMELLFRLRKMRQIQTMFKKKKMKNVLMTESTRLKLNKKTLTKFLSASTSTLRFSFTS